MSVPLDGPILEEASAVGELEAMIALLETSIVLRRQELRGTIQGIQSRCQHQFQPVSKTHQLDDGSCVVVVGSQCPDGSGSMPVRCPKCSYMEDVDIRAHCLCGAKPKEVALDESEVVKLLKELNSPSMCRPWHGSGNRWLTLRCLTCRWLFVFYVIGAQALDD